ncbi:hypothetical protein CGRA01v4_05299 [Colletotrichum graminicola]|nr:hypothetical protein CGRA01v4_05299 [Colletotrichum graminicola]
MRYRQRPERETTSCQFCKPRQDRVESRPTTQVRRPLAGRIRPELGCGDAGRLRTVSSLKAVSCIHVSKGQPHSAVGWTQVALRPHRESHLFMCHLVRLAGMVHGRISFSHCDPRVRAYRNHLISFHFISLAALLASPLLCRLNYVDVEDFDILLWLLLVCPCVLDFVDNIQSLSSTPENSVLSVQPRLH